MTSLSPFMISIMMNEYLTTDKPISQLSLEYGINTGTFIKIRQREGIEKREFTAPWKNKKKFDECYFNNIDTSDKAYWLGFIAADGFIRLRKKCLSLILKLSVKDNSQIEKFKHDVGASEHPIHIYSQFNKKTKKHYQCSVIELHNRHICNGLIKHGVGPDKSKELHFPNISKELLPDFSRGYFDGDGWFCNTANAALYGLVGSSYDFISEYRKYLADNCNTNPNIKIHCKKGCYIITYGGNIQCQRIYKNYYDNNNKCLERKQIKAFNHFKNYKDFLQKNNNEDINDSELQLIIENYENYINDEL